MSDVAEAKAKREPAAEKTYLDAAGQPAEIEKAVSLSYKSLADGKTVVLPVSTYPSEVILMLALFGASTQATNTASQNRNAKGEDQLASDADAVLARFSRMEPGDWGTKAAGGGFQIDLEILYAALIQVHKREPADPVAYKAELDADATLKKTLRNHKDVAPVYDEMIRAKRAPAESKPLDQLLGF